MRVASSALLLAAAATAAGAVERRQDPTPTTSVFVPPTVAPAPNINSSEYDMTKHFCRLWRHASVYADGKIYIDGGETYSPKNNGTFNNTPEGNWTKGINNHLLVLDLSRNFTSTDTFPYSRILKGPQVPGSLMEHALWYSQTQRKIYQLGGWWSASNSEDPGFKELRQIPEAEIWEFSIDSSTWSKATDLSLVNFRHRLQRQGAAAFCDAPALDKSFIFQGYSEQRSEKEYIDYEQWSEYKFISGMLALDTSVNVQQPTLTNISVPQRMGDIDFGPRMNGAMVHIPVGEKGVLVQIGGQITVNPTPYGVRIPGASGGNHNIKLDFVDIYDIQSGFWFRQKTFGLGDGKPIGRSDICTVVVPAKDKSSYQIYMVSGMDNYATHVTLGEIWVLSIPSFQWILVNRLPEGFYGHTCHLVGENLVLIGGMETNPEGDVRTCSPHMPANIYSLVAQNFTGRFDAAGANRLAPVPSKVIQAVGGTSEGGAHITSPVEWSDIYLQYVFNPTLQRPTDYAPKYVLANASEAALDDLPPPPSKTPDPTPSSGPNSALIGGVVGGILGALLLGAIAFFIVWRRKKAAANAAGPPELPAYTADNKTYYGGLSPSVSQVHGPAELTNPAYGMPRSELGNHEHQVSELDSGTVSHSWASPTSTFASPASAVEKRTPVSSTATPVGEEGRPRMQSWDVSAAGSDRG
ncbi:hypothetical protein OQA88_8742 [Cercophora sp. LCS_1]